MNVNYSLLGTHNIQGTVVRVIESVLWCHMSSVVSQFLNWTVCSTAYSGCEQIKHQRRPMDSPNKGPVMRTTLSYRAVSCMFSKLYLHGSCCNEMDSSLPIIRDNTTKEHFWGWDFKFSLPVNWTSKYTGLVIEAMLLPLLSADYNLLLSILQNTNWLTDSDNTLYKIMMARACVIHAGLLTHWNKKVQQNISNIGCGQQFVKC